MTSDADSGSTISVEVVYALPERSSSVRLQLANGSTVSAALADAGIAGLDEGVEIDPARLAIFSRPATLATILRDGDRLEILRPLTADPKQSRRTRAIESRPKKN